MTQKARTKQRRVNKMKAGVSKPKRRPARSDLDLATSESPRAMVGKAKMLGNKGVRNVQELARVRAKERLHDPKNPRPRKLPLHAAEYYDLRRKEIEMSSMGKERDDNIQVLNDEMEHRIKRGDFLKK